ncbi:MAG: OadG family protein [Chloroflexota bacterium]
MPEELGEGLYLAAAGMGLVFLSLLAFMLILFALRKFFPSEEVAESIETEEAPAAVETEEAQQASEEPAPAELRAAAPDGAIGGRIPGAKIAAIAVGVYLATEQEEHVDQAPVVDRAAIPSLNDSAWNILGRDPSWGSQGRRPPPYGRSTRSTYPPKDSVKE